MLCIRDEQLRWFENAALRTFSANTASYLEREYPAAFEELGAAALAELVRDGLREAKDKGIVTRGAAMVYIELVLIFGKGFELSPDRRWAEKILAHPTLPDYSKMEIIRARLVERSEGRVVRRSAAERDGEE